MTPRIFILLVVWASLDVPAWAVPETEVDIVGEMTNAGRRLLHPDRAHPVYYLPLMSAFSDLGASLDKGQLPPSEYDVAHEVAVALSHQGYLLANPGFKVNDKKEVIYADGTTVRVPASPRLNRPIIFNSLRDDPLTLAAIEAASGPYSMYGPSEYRVGRRRVQSPLVQLLRYVDPDHGQVIQNLPSIVLTIQWGVMHTHTSIGDRESSGPAFDSIYGQLLKTLVAGTNWDNLAYWQKAELFRKMADDRYFVVIGAYDFQSCLRNREKVLLWSAKMSVRADLDAKFADMLALLVKAGESHIGRESLRPELITVPLVQDGRVIVGNPEIVGDHVSPTPPATAPEK